MNLEGGGGEIVENDFASSVFESAKLEDTGGALFYAGGAADALGIFHGEPFVGKVHDIDALMAHAGADVAGDAFFLLRENSILREARINMHQRR